MPSFYIRFLVSFSTLIHFSSFQSSCASSAKTTTHSPLHPDFAATAPLVIRSDYPVVDTGRRMWSLSACQGKISALILVPSSHSRFERTPFPLPPRPCPGSHPPSSRAPPSLTSCLPLSLRTSSFLTVHTELVRRSRIR